MLLADTSFIVALLNRKDRFSLQAGQYMLGLPPHEQIVFPSVAFTEVAYLLETAGNSRLRQAGLRRLHASRIQHIDLLDADYEHAFDILDKYADSRIDFVDACIMALAERLAVTRILTYDRRDFGLFRPAHVPAFDLLP